MPLTPKGQKIKSSMVREYGPKKGESVFYASRNAGTISGVDKKRDVASKMPFRKVKGTDFKTLTGDKGSRDLAKFLARFKSSPAGKKAGDDRKAWNAAMEKRHKDFDLFGNKR